MVTFSYDNVIMAFHAQKSTLKHSSYQ